MNYFLFTACRHYESLRPVASKLTNLKQINENET